MTFSSLSARDRIQALVDPDTFQPVENSADTSFALGSAQIAGQPVLLAFSDGHRRGGTFGVREAELISDLLGLLPASDTPPAVIFGFDTGGVRVEEGPRALAATSGAGVAFARLSWAPVRTMAIVSGPRGCFGAPSLMASLPQRVAMIEGSHLGLTGPKLIDTIRALEDDAAWRATSAAHRLANGDCHLIIPDATREVVEEVRRFLAMPPAPPPNPAQTIELSAQRVAEMARRLRGQDDYRSPVPRRPRRRGLMEYSLRRQWQPTEPLQRAGMVQVGFGTLSGRPAVGVIVGPEASAGDGLGIEEAALITSMLQRAAAMPGPRAMVLNFLFCQGHAVDVTQEKLGLHRALAECLRAMVAARALGHPIVSVLGGGTYGAAYFALAAPSHRILAMQGTSVAPMAPEVLRAFEQLRGKDLSRPADVHLAEHIPDVRIVRSVIRLPRALRDELTGLIESRSNPPEDGPGTN